MDFMDDPRTCSASLAAPECEGKDHLRTASTSSKRLRSSRPGPLLIIGTGRVMAGHEREEYRRDFSQITLMPGLIETLMALG
jgi:hypothetical protein